MPQAVSGVEYWNGAPAFNSFLSQSRMRVKGMFLFSDASVLASSGDEGC